MVVAVVVVGQVVVVARYSLNVVTPDLRVVVDTHLVELIGGITGMRDVTACSTGTAH